MAKCSGTCFSTFLFPHGHLHTAQVNKTYGCFIRGINSVTWIAMSAKMNVKYCTASFISGLFYKSHNPTNNTRKCQNHADQTVSRCQFLRLHSLLLNLPLISFKEPMIGNIQKKRLRIEPIRHNRKIFLQILCDGLACDGVSVCQSIYLTISRMFEFKFEVKSCVTATKAEWLLLWWWL